MVFLTAPLATVLAALISAFLGSWLGASTALARFRRERAFDRQLDRYERTVRSLHKLAEAISIGMVFEDEQRGDDGFWGQVQVAHLETLRAINEADLYGSKTAIDHADRTLTLVQKRAAESNIYEPRNMTDQAAQTVAFEAMRQLPQELMDIAKPIAEEARHHLGLK